MHDLQTIVALNAQAARDAFLRKAREIEKVHERQHEDQLRHAVEELRKVRDVVRAAKAKLDELYEYIDDNDLHGLTPCFSKADEKLREAAAAVTEGAEGLDEFVRFLLELRRPGELQDE